MTWMQFSHGLRLDPIAKGSPEALVVLLYELGASAATLPPIAARWATAVPTFARDAVVLAACLTVERTSLPAFGWLWRNRRRLWAKRREIQAKVRARQRDSKRNENAGNAARTRSTQRERRERSENAEK